VPDRVRAAGASLDLGPLQRVLDAAPSTSARTSAAAAATRAA